MKPLNLNITVSDLLLHHLLHFLAVKMFGVCSRLSHLQQCQIIFHTEFKFRFGGDLLLHAKKARKRTRFYESYAFEENFLV